MNISPWILMVSITDSFIQQACMDLQGGPDPSFYKSKQFYI